MLAVVVLVWPLLAWLPELVLLLELLVGLPLVGVPLELPLGLLLWGLLVAAELVLTCDVVGFEAAVEVARAEVRGVPGPVLVGLALGLVVVGLVFPGVELVGVPRVEELPGVALPGVALPGAALVVPRVALGSLEGRAVVEAALDVVGRTAAEVVAEAEVVREVLVVASSPCAAALSGIELLAPRTTMPSPSIDTAADCSSPPWNGEEPRRESRLPLGVMESTTNATPPVSEVTAPALSAGSAAGAAAKASSGAAWEGGVTVATATPAPAAARTSAPALTSARMVRAFTYPPRAGATDPDDRAPIRQFTHLPQPCRGAVTS